MGIPPARLRQGNDAPVREDGAFVLYWMIAYRRLGWNFALDRAIARARELGKPLIVLEPLRAGYEWASDRFHRFVLDGMADSRARAEGTPVLYHPYLEPAPGDGKGLLETLGKEAALVVTDDYPSFFLPRMVAKAGSVLPVRLEIVDSNGLLPVRVPEKVHTTAYSLRRELQKKLGEHLLETPAPDPLKGLELPKASLPASVTDRWPAVAGDLLEGGGDGLAAFPIDHSVGPVPYRGGAEAAGAALSRFLDERLDRYAEERNEPDADAASGLSPYLHWGHLSVHRVFRELADREGWSPGRLGDSADGKREGWWGMSPSAEAFLDELVTWRELGFNMTSRRDDYADYDSLPDWARATLADHEADEREHVYDLDTFAAAETHDELWNAAQRELRREGRIQNYLRMLWGKKILEWTRSPREALEVMLELNNRYAVDGRDPNSYSGIFWVLGRYDRGWPEREIFGKVRYMTSASTRRKYSVAGYLERFGEE